ncbi:MAG: rod shape-determining protein [Anaerolineales bacterium]|nr:rod shape-determining protein [Anaerolineales bacterium]MCW5855676.1 rod shape-determining protein [Anaerolineales bacterium]
MAILSRELGIDLGTMFIRIVEGGEVVLQEPTIVAVDLDEQKIVAVGDEALGMVGRVLEESIEVIRPLQKGVVAYYELTELLIDHLVRKIGGSVRFFKPRVMVTHPYAITSVERRAVHEAALQVGDAHLVPQPLAAALGIDLPVGTPTGNMVVSMGGGCTQAAVIAMNDVVSGDTLRVGGLDLDDAIAAYVRRKYGLHIGQRTAEMVKLRVGAAIPQDEEHSIELQGQDQITGLPRPMTITTSEVVEAVQPTLDEMFEMVRQVLEKTPPELASDIIDRGVAICGGGALLRGMDRLMTQKLGVPAYLVDDPVNCTAIGALRAVDMAQMLQRINRL